MNTCKLCQTGFEITAEDEGFYIKMEVPKPTFCSDCRKQRKLAFRNERGLYKRKCDGTNRQIISMYDEPTDFPVYDIKHWWSDDWDALEYGRDYDFSRLFFEQFAELYKEVPRMSLMQSQNENADFTNNVSNLKDCYLLFSSDFNRSCSYGVWIENCKDCLDNYMLEKSELTYDSIFSQKLYNCVSALFCSNCSDVSFMIDCRNCNNCFMCFGLRNKSYCIENKQYTKEEYEEKLKTLTYETNKKYNELKSKFLKALKNIPYMNLHRNGRIEDSDGDFLTDTKNCHECYSLSNAKDCKYIEGGFDLKDAMDCCYANGELGYETCECVPMPFNSKFNINSYSGSDLQYCDLCMNNCKDCFGCISLRHKQYCILNKQYSKEEYEKILPKIIEHMKSTGEYGEFFPLNLSPFGYNESNAHDYYPLKKEEATAQGYKWKDPDEKEYMPATSEILACSECKKNYKLIDEEKKFYNKLSLPDPQKCPECRQKARFNLTNPRHLHDHNCAKCQAPVRTTYKPEQPEIIYCEKCYTEALT